MNEKITWIRNSLKVQGIQGMIVSNPVNIHYLTNIDAEGVLLLTLKENYYITDDRYIEKVQSILRVDDEIIVTNVRELSPEDYENFFMFCENVGFEENYVTYAKYKSIMPLYKIHSLVETEGIIEKQRQIKDKEEIEYIKMACRITDGCFSHILNYIKKGMTEIQIAYEIEKYFKENNAVPAFDTIVASGENSSMPHATPGNRRIHTGDAITIDMGCSYNGYCSDMTRTIFVDNVGSMMKDVYDLVLNNQEIILGEIKERNFCKSIIKDSRGKFQDEWI